MVPANCWFKRCSNRARAKPSVQADAMKTESKSGGYCRRRGRRHRQSSRDPRLPQRRRARRASPARRRRTTPRPGLRSPVGIPESQFLGWCPSMSCVRPLLRPRSASGTRQCRERKTPKVDRQVRVGGSRRVCRRLTLVFLVFHLCVGLPPLESCVISCGKTADAACN